MSGRCEGYVAGTAVLFQPASNGRYSRRRGLRSVRESVMKKPARMNRRPLWLGLAATSAAAIAVIGVSAAAVAAPQAAPSNNPGRVRSAPPAPVAAKTTSGRTVKTVTHHYSLAASAFAPDGLHDVTEDYFNAWDPSTLSNTDAGRCFDAGLSLPV